MFEKLALTKPDKVHDELNEHLIKCRKLMDAFELQEKLPMASIPSAINIPAIYGLWERGQCIYIGRTRKLANRLRGHKSRSTYSATFAVRIARFHSGLQANYLAGNSAAALLKNNEVFQEAFGCALTRIRLMEFSFVRVDDMIEQYFFELFATRRFGLSDAAFGTH